MKFNKRIARFFIFCYSILIVSGNSSETITETAIIPGMKPSDYEIKKAFIIEQKLIVYVKLNVCFRLKIVE